jgi:hypothetical protein
VALLEGRVAGTRRADEVVDHPVIALGQPARTDAARRSSDCSLLDGVLEVDRNFRQDFLSAVP